MKWDEEGLEAIKACLAEHGLRMNIERQLNGGDIGILLEHDGALVAHTEVILGMKMIPQGVVKIKMEGDRVYSQILCIRASSGREGSCERHAGLRELLAMETPSVAREV